MPKVCRRFSKLAPWRPVPGLTFIDICNNPLVFSHHCHVKKGDIWPCDDSAALTSWIILFRFIVPIRDKRKDVDSRWKLVRTSGGSSKACRVVFLGRINLVCWTSFHLISNKKLKIGNYAETKAYSSRRKDTKWYPRLQSAPCGAVQL